MERMLRNIFQILRIKKCFCSFTKTNLTATKEIYIEAKVKGGGKKLKAKQ